MKEFDNINVEKEQQEDGFDFRVIFGYLRAYWWLFVLSVMVCFAGAFLYLRNATPIYNITAKVLLQDSEKGGTVLSPADMLVDFGMQNRVSNVENEMALMSSMTVVRRAVVDTNLYTTYVWGEDSILYNETTPIVAAFGDEAMSNLPCAIKVTFTVFDGANVSAVYEVKEVPGGEVAIPSFPFVLDTPLGEVFVSRNEAVELAKKFGQDESYSFVNGVLARFAS